MLKSSVFTNAVKPPALRSRLVQGTRIRYGTSKHVERRVSWHAPVGLTGNAVHSGVNPDANSTVNLPVPEGVRDEAQWAGYMLEYAELKECLLSRTRQTGAIMALYVLFALDGKGSLCTLVGTSCAYVYLLWLFSDIDRLKETYVTFNTGRGQFPLFAILSKAFGAYRQSLQPRLLVPIAAAALFAAANSTVGEIPLMYEGCVLAGFFAYKISLLTVAFDSLSLKRLDEEDTWKPTLAAVEDELDMYGRPKPRTASPIEALPEDMQAAAQSELAKDIAKKLEN